MADRLSSTGWRMGSCIRPNNGLASLAITSKSQHNVRETKIHLQGVYMPSINAKVSTQDKMYAEEGAMNCCRL